MCLDNGVCSPVDNNSHFPTIGITQQAESRPWRLRGHAFYRAHPFHQAGHYVFGQWNLLACGQQLPFFLLLPVQGSLSEENHFLGPLPIFGIDTFAFGVETETPWRKQFLFAV